MLHIIEDICFGHHKFFHYDFRIRCYSLLSIIRSNCGQRGARIIQKYK